MALLTLRSKYMYGVLEIATAASAFTEDDLICVFAAPLQVISHKTNSASDTVALRRLHSVGTAQRWEIETDVFMNRAAHKFFINLITKDIGALVFIRMPQPIIEAADAFGVGVPSKGLVVSKGSAAVNGVHLPGAVNIALAIDSGACLVEGGFIRFANSPKVYMVIGMSDETLNQSVEIHPPLVGPLTDTEAVSLGEDVVMSAYYDADTVIGMRYSDGILADPGTVKFVEAL